MSASNLSNQTLPVTATTTVFEGQSRRCSLAANEESVQNQVCFICWALSSYQTVYIHIATLHTAWNVLFEKA